MLCRLTIAGEGLLQVLFHANPLLVKQPQVGQGIHILRIPVDGLPQAIHRHGLILLHAQAIRILQGHSGPCTSQPLLYRLAPPGKGGHIVLCLEISVRQSVLRSGVAIHSGVLILRHGFFQHSLSLPLQFRFYLL